MPWCVSCRSFAVEVASMHPYRSVWLTVNVLPQHVLKVYVSAHSLSAEHSQTAVKTLLQERMPTATQKRSSHAVTAYRTIAKVFRCAGDWGGLKVLQADAAPAVMAA